MDTQHCKITTPSEVELIARDKSLGTTHKVIPFPPGYSSPLNPTVATIFSSIRHSWSLLNIGHPLVIRMTLRRGQLHYPAFYFELPLSLRQEHGRLSTLAPCSFTGLSSGVWFGSEKQEASSRIEQLPPKPLSLPHRKPALAAKPGCCLYGPATRRIDELKANVWFPAPVLLPSVGASVSGRVERLDMSLSTDNIA